LVKKVPSQSVCATSPCGPDSLICPHGDARIIFNDLIGTQEGSGISGVRKPIATQKKELFAPG
jgi:hypothetical protein